MYIVIDSEGTPIQEWSAIVVEEKSSLIRDIFHGYVRYPFVCDEDYFARKYIHGLRVKDLACVGFSDVNVLLTEFRHWLRPYASCPMYAHAPAKESQFLSCVLQDVCLPPWKERVKTVSHSTAKAMKLNQVPICNITCTMHDPVYYKSHRQYPNETDLAKAAFGYHCSLYDCYEIFLWLQNMKMTL